MFQTYAIVTAHTAGGGDASVTSLRQGRIAPNQNVYAALDGVWAELITRPTEAAHVLGKLLVALGPERIVWGTDSAWYGSPQPLIDAFRAFEIPERMQEQYGYPALTRAAKDRILSANAQALYGFSAAPRVDGAWSANAAVELRRAIAAAGLAAQ